jgi:hypothetical protein
MWPARIDYEEGDDVVPGYELKTRSNRNLVVGGLVTFLIPYSFSFIAGGAAALEGSDRDQEQYAPLLVPVLGPFISLGMFRSVDETDAFILLADGFTQAAGAAMITVGILMPDQYLERIATLPGKPEVFVGAKSATVRLHF